MAKLAGAIWVVSLIIFAPASQNDKLKRLHSVEAYEILPAILITPSYSSEGDICRVVIEKRHVSPDGVDLDAEMSAEQIHQVFEELAPQRDRGRPAPNQEAGTEITTIEGPTLVTTVAYQNVSLRMYGRNSKRGATGYIAAVIQWKKGCGPG